MNVIYLLIILQVVVNKTAKKHIINTLSLEEKKEKVLEIPIELSFQDSPLINICYGHPPQCFKVKIVTNFCESFIKAKKGNNPGFDISASHTVLNEMDKFQFIYSVLKLQGYLLQDTILIKYINISIPNFSFYLITDGADNLQYDGVIGLGQVYFDSSLSIMNQLYVNNHIRNLIFSTKFFDKERKGILTFGYHKISHEDRYKVTDLLWNQESKYFEIRMNAIFLYNDKEVFTYSKVQNTLISPGSNKNFCPKEFFDFVQKTLLRSSLKKDGICELSNEGPFKLIRCKGDINDYNFGRIKFIFGKWNVEYEMNKLFAECDFGYLCFEIAYFEGNTRWVFGYSFIKDFHVIFDKKEMKLYMKRNNINKK